MSLAFAAIARVRNVAHQRRPNAGVAWQDQTESFYLPEAPSNSVMASLSDILEPDRDPRYRLTAAHAAKMLARLVKYKKANGPLADALREFIRNSETSH